MPQRVDISAKRDENGHAITAPRHGATGAGSMGRKVEVKEFELSTKLMNSEKLKNMVESSSKRL